MSRKEPNVAKHILPRIGILIVTNGLIFLILYLIDQRSGILGALFLSAYFLGAWLLYMLVEMIILFATKRRGIAFSNLITLLILLFFLALVVVEFA